MNRTLFLCIVSCAFVSCASAINGTTQDEAADDVAIAHGNGTADRTGECSNSSPDLNPHSLASRNKRLVKKAMTELFAQHDVTAIDRYWGEPYIQHNPQVKNGKDGLRELLASSPSDNTYEMGAVLAEGNMVTVHGRDTGLGATPLVIIDLFRLKDNKIVEHWDVIQNEVPVSQTASGNPMFTACP